MDNLDEQPMPGEQSVIEGAPCCLELTAANGQPLVMLILREVPVEDIVLTVIPAIREQSGLRGPLGFKMRGLTAEEQKALEAAQR